MWRNQEPGLLDYVAGWYVKAMHYIAGHHISISDIWTFRWKAKARAMLLCMRNRARRKPTNYLLVDYGAEPGGVGTTYAQAHQPLFGRRRRYPVAEPHEPDRQGAANDIWQQAD
jgi:hypothetical protein